MDLIQLFQDFGVNYATEGFKYCRPGWVNVDCPYCVAHSPGPHLGFNLETTHCNCWACGWHPTIPTIAKLLSQSIPGSPFISTLKASLFLNFNSATNLFA